MNLRAANEQCPNEAALAEGAMGDGSKTCYKTITVKISSQIYYCGTCSWVDNSTFTTFSGTGKCP